MPNALPAMAADVLTRLRARRPRVHCVTNAVAQNFTANALLAAGCVPSMTIAPEEIGDFVRGADALLVNLGTFDGERRRAVTLALAAAAETDVPWLLDPVLIDRSPQRAAFARNLLSRQPNAVRLNSTELAILTGGQSAADCARSHNMVIALSGATDVVSDGSRLAFIDNGHPWMAKVTAMGCAASALAAACLAVERDAWQGCVAALLIFGVAGEIAAERSAGPGTFAAAILDALHSVQPDDLIKKAKVS